MKSAWEILDTGYRMWHRLGLEVSDTLESDLLPLVDDLGIWTRLRRLKR
jgi:hypothetical protein